MEEGKACNNRSVSIIDGHDQCVKHSTSKPAQRQGRQRHRQTANNSYRRMHARHGREGEAMSLACLVCCALPVRFVARPFSPPYSTLHPTRTTPHPPGDAGEGVAGQKEGKREKSFPRQGSIAVAPRKGPLFTSFITAHSPPIPITTTPSRSARVKADRARASRGGGNIMGSWDLGTLGLCGGGGTHDDGGGPEKDTWRKRRSESTYIHIRPAQPNPIQAVPRSFLSTSTFPVELELVLELAPHFDRG